jgi:hypothetical protein
MTPSAADRDALVNYPKLSVRVWMPEEEGVSATVAASVGVA